MKPEFGNPDHIKLVQEGVVCVCGHKQTDHDEGNNYCIEEVEEECNCPQCGNEHIYMAECDCEQYLNSLNA